MITINRSEKERRHHGRIGDIRRGSNVNLVLGLAVMEDWLIKVAEPSSKFSEGSF